jgi:hypothetical protein
MIVLLSKVLEGPAGALLTAVFWGIITKIVIIPGKFFRGCGLYILWVFIGPIFSFYSLRFWVIFLDFVLVLLGCNSISLGFLFYLYS